MNNGNNHIKANNRKYKVKEMIHQIIKHIQILIKKNRVILANNNS